MSTLPDVCTNAERHYALAGAYAMAAESRCRIIPVEVHPRVAEARGRLIAADRDLLRAAKLALREIERLYDAQPRENFEDNAAVKLLKPAIAKARGR